MDHSRISLGVVVSLVVISYASFFSVMIGA